MNPNKKEEEEEALNEPTKMNPKAHISTQFYTFNTQSHSLMISSLSQNRLPSPQQIKAVTSADVLQSWRSVWKDRNEDTAYLTAWKRIQDKLTPFLDANGNRFLSFKNNNNNNHQFVSHFDQWYDIVMSNHVDGLEHFGVRDTIDRIKQCWTVGAKFYGIPESFIRVCVSSCRVCSSGLASEMCRRPKRRKFEYTESFEVSASEVMDKLQELARLYKVVLCIRQKYIRYKPFMAEVKDYACHRAGEPSSSSKKVVLGKVFKREPYASKRCGCGFRIRAIVPITNYNEKDKSFVYEEEGVAVFKMYAVHSGHEPGPLDGSARIMHRVVGHKGVFLGEEGEYGVNEEMEGDGFGFGGLGRDDGDFSQSVLQQVYELKSLVGTLESRIPKLSLDALEAVSRDLCDIVNKVRMLGDDETTKSGLLGCEKPISDDMLVGNGDGDLPHWNDPHEDRLYVDGKDTDLIDEDDDSFTRSLHDVVPWGSMRTHCRSAKDLISESCKADKWLDDSGEFDEKSILNCEESKLTKPILRCNDSLEEDVGLVHLQVDSFYHDNPKWYDSPCGLDPSIDCVDSEFRHEEIV